MAERLSRQELYERVWSEPMRTLAPRFGISDVALKKACARANVPTPERGYWAKKEAGRPTRPVPLPPRAAGMDEEVDVGGGDRWHRQWSRDELLAPAPPAPEFEDTLEVVRDRVAKTVGRVTVPPAVRAWHPAIERLLLEDEKRHQKQLASPYPAPWDAPIFGAPLERRRLRLLNSLFLAAAKVGGKPTMRGREARDVHLTFHHQHVGLTLDSPKARGPRGQAVGRAAGTDRLHFAVLMRLGSEEIRASWTDEDGAKLEARMTEIAVEVVLAAEIQHREGAIRHHRWRIERKAQLEEEERKRRAEAERAERERRERLEQARIDRLLKDAAASWQASEIRSYVAAVTARVRAGCHADPEQLERWSTWALAQADRIDPALRGAFLKAQDDS